MTSAINHQDVRAPALEPFDLFCVALWNNRDDWKSQMLELLLVADRFAGAARYAARFGDVAHADDLLTLANLAYWRAVSE